MADKRSPRGESSPDVARQEEIRQRLRAAALAFDQWRQRLEELSRSLPEGEYAEGTDEPLDLPAAWRGMIEATVQDELGPAIDCLEHASRITSDPATWYRHG